jgi:mannose/fructose/sorbose-specific phosphotransferase system IIA component
MLGIVLCSHGNMARGMADTVKLFVGNDIKQFEVCCLESEDNPEEFANVILKAINKVNDGNKVLILTDLFGGTPCNQAIKLLNDDIECIAGVNLPILLTVLTSREFNNIDILSLIEVGKSGLVNVKVELQNLVLDENDE